jgi:hypothetical protein
METVNARDIIKTAGPFIFFAGKQNVKNNSP